MSHRILVVAFALLFVLGSASFASAGTKPHHTKKKPVKKLVPKKERRHGNHHHNHKSR